MPAQRPQSHPQPRTLSLLAFSLFALLLSLPAALHPVHEPEPSPAKSARQTLTINRDWTFNYYPQHETPTQAPAYSDFNDTLWPAIAIPHTWSTYETTRAPHPFIHAADEKNDTYWWYGWGWYRKRLHLDETLSGKRIALEFDGVQKYSRLYINGQFVGEHKGGYTSFSFDITPYVQFGAKNLIALQVSNRQTDAGHGIIPPAQAGNFNVYGGIYRDVRLVITDKLHIPYQGSADHEGGTHITTPNLTPGATTAQVRVRTYVKNDHPTPRTALLVTTIHDPDNKIILTATATQTIPSGQLHEFDQLLTPIPAPRLWSPETPTLYTVTSELTTVVDKEILLAGGGPPLRAQVLYPADYCTSPLGFRTFHWDYTTDRLILNGHPVWLRGTNRHQEFPWLGDAMPKWMHDRDLADMRHNMGLNSQRTAHYPNDPRIYHAADRLGFLIIEEVPNIKDIPFDRETQRRNLLEMIRRDRNHPSIIKWSMGNETNQPASSDWACAEDTTRIIHMRRCNHGAAYYGAHIQTTDKNIALENLLRCAVRGWLNNDDHDFSPLTGRPESWQVAGTEEWHHQKIRTTPALLATTTDLTTNNIITWLYADHGCRREYLNAPLLYVNPKGWVDSYRIPKLTYHLWRANYTATPMVYIHPTYWRPRYIGQTHDIQIDSNCAQVELLLDGQSLGTQIPAPANSHSVTFKNVPVTPGVLTARATPKDGAPAIETRLPMPGPPAKLTLATSHATIPADRSGIAQITAGIVDADGNHIHGANPPLTWSITGPARLLAPENYTTDTRKNGARDGAMYIDLPVSNLVRSTATPGEIRVTITSPDLAPAEITIHSIAITPDTIPGVTQPALSDANRHPVTRDPHFQTVVFAPKNQYIEEIREDADFPPADNGSYRNPVTKFVEARNHGIDEFSTAYRAFLERMIQITTDRAGHLVADDWNFEARALNEKLATPHRQSPQRQKAPQKNNPTHHPSNPLPSTPTTHHQPHP